MKLEKYTNIDEYIANFPKSVQEKLEEMRGVVQEVAPNATESINYGIPTFKLNNKNLVHFAGYENHVGFYPGSKVIEEYRDVLSTYKTSKGTVQFSLENPLPLTLIAEMTASAKKHLN